MEFGSCQPTSTWPGQEHATWEGLEWPSQSLRTQKTLTFAMTQGDRQV